MTHPKILIVEDKESIVRDIREMLEQLEYQVVAAADSGEKALKKVEETGSDLVLMDIQLKGGHPSFLGLHFCPHAFRFQS
jgi:CheY-like chemotaxis protein